LLPLGYNRRTRQFRQHPIAGFQGRRHGSGRIQRTQLCMRRRKQSRRASPNANEDVPSIPPQSAGQICQRRSPRMRKRRATIPRNLGGFPSKTGVIRTITALAGQLGMQEKTHSGAHCLGGHAMRRGGAQYLAAAGVDVWRLQALARHSSSAILASIEKKHTSRR
jgi:integrase